MHLSQNSIGWHPDLNDKWNKHQWIITLVLILDNGVSDFQNIEPRGEIHSHFHHKFSPTVSCWPGTKIVKI